MVLAHPSPQHPWLIPLFLTRCSEAENMAYEFPRTFLSVLNLVLLHTASDCSLEYRQPKEFIIRHLSSTDPFTFWTLKNECILDICENNWDTLFFSSIESIPLTDFDCIYSYIIHHCLIKEHLSFYLLSLLHLNIMFSVSSVISHMARFSSWLSNTALELH